ncbi:ankyrin repeat-containing protein At5g02620-like [Humulus lupulus]|uniref:ankyrin repeat-containing protein At5g02620-like n=1 Tax=Humulus lupulus TaxID=3486 RepID=UPI002B4071C9|nr:ankyrin repeat-containing protein At5g02620-like [Humulus lupulus]
MASISTEVNKCSLDHELCIFKLHDAVKSGHKGNIVKLLKENECLNAVESNKNGDTPLHVAARLGHLEVVKFLLNEVVDFEAGNSSDLLAKTNKKESTALHEAVTMNKLEIVKLLIDKDSNLVYSNNKDGESPLFLAIDRELDDIAIFILSKVHYVHGEGLSQNRSWSGRNGLNVMHAVVIRNNGRITQKIKGKPDIDIDTDVMEAVFQKYGDDILQEKDKHGWTPLHYAVHLNEISLVYRFMSPGGSPLCCIQDNEGMSPLHISARNGSFRAACALTTNRLGIHSRKMFQLLDNNDRTVLHVTAESKNTLFFASNILFWDECQDVINWKDKDGNTCLHLAILSRNYAMVTILLYFDKVYGGVLDKYAVNNKGMTANDILYDNYDPILGQSILLLMKVFSFCSRSLESVHPKESSNETLTRELKQDNGENKLLPSKDIAQESSNETLTRELKQDNGENKLLPKDIAQESSTQILAFELKLGNDIANVNLLVATIVASITFAAGVQIPGGYNDAGMAILKDNASFKLFMVFNSLAFGFSAASIFFNFKLALYQKRFCRPTFSVMAINLNVASIASTVLAYAMSTKSTLLDTKTSPWVIASSAFVIPVAYFIIHLYFYFLRLLITGRK